MKLQKIILCVAIATTAFGASLGLLEIGAYIRTVFEPALKVEVKPLEPIQPPVFYPPRIPNFAPPAFTSVEESEPIEEAEPEDWGETGDYYIVDDKPKGFEEFLSLSVEDRVWSEKFNQPVPVKPKASIETGVGETKTTRIYDFSWININNKRLSLVTKAKKGVSYQFDGKFVEQEVKLKTEAGEEYTETVYLKGRLTKWRDGKKIAEAKVRFTINHGC